MALSRYSRILMAFGAVTAICQPVARASRQFQIQFISDTEAVVYLNREGELQEGDTLYLVSNGQRQGEGAVSQVNGLQANVHLQALAITPVPGRDVLVLTGGYSRMRMPARQPATVGLTMNASPAEAPEEEATDPLEALYFGEEGEVVAIATLTPRREITSPSTVSVLRREDLAQMANKRLGELFEDLPGFNTLRLSRSNQEISIRGFNREFSNKILVLLDGQPLHREYFGNTFWETIPVGVEELDRVEVIRGPGSALYGENAFLGVVNFITKKSFANGKEYYVRPAIEDGNFHLAGGATLNIPVSRRKLLVSAAGEHLSNYGGEAVSSFGPTNGSLDVSQGVQRLFVRTAEGGPWQAAYGMSRTRKRLDSAATQDKAEQETDLLNVSYEDGDFSARFGLDRFEETSTGGQFSSLNLQTNQVVQERRQNFEALLKHRRWGASDWTIGMQFKDSHASGGFLPEAQDRTTVSGMASGDISLGGVVATLGLRYDNNDFENRVSPRLSLVREINGGQSLRFSYGAAFRSPTFYELGYFNQPPPITLSLSEIDLGSQEIPPGINGGELIYTIQGNPNLKSERINSLEIGYAKQTPVSSLGLTLFSNRIDNLIAPLEIDDPACPGGYCGIHPTDPTKLLFAGNATFKNVGEATSNGLELDYRRDLNESLSVLYRMSWQLTKLQNFGGDVPFSPRTLSSLQFRYKTDEKTSLRATLRYQGTFNALQALNSSPRKEAHRTILDVGMTQEVASGGGRFDVDVLNALNNEVTDSPNYEPSGRIFRGSVTIYY